MIDYIYGHNDVVSSFVASLIPAARNRGFGRCSTIGVINDDGDLIAGIVYHNWNPEAGVIELSGAALPGSNWLTRETLKHMYRYPFLQIGCQMVMQMTAEEDERTLRQLAAFNYSFILIPRILGPDKNGVVCLLTREAWEENKVCKRYRHHIPEDQPAERAA